MARKLGTSEPMEGEQNRSSSSSYKVESGVSKSRLNDELEVPSGDGRNREVGAVFMWLKGPSGAMAWPLARSLSGALGVGEVMPVMLECGPGETVVALDDGSTDTPLPSMRASAAEISSPPCRAVEDDGDGPSTDELGSGWSEPASGDSVVTWIWRAGRGDCWTSSGQVEKA